MFLKTFIRNSSRNWVHRPPPIETEKFAEQFRSKSALKLLELNDRYKFLQPGARVLDLGASPGGWSEVAAKAVESTEAKPLVLGVDIISCLPLKGANFIIADVTKEETPSEIMKAMKHPADVVLSDLSEPLNYDIDIDCIISVSLCLDVIRIANFTLKPGGCMLIKLFIGNEEPKHYVYNI
jgi:23S rRNA (uridine2552-2'-O)-methyltransferase